MKKFIFLILLITKTSYVQAIETTAVQGILYDYETKSILFEKNADELMSPSSMSKIMTIYYVFQKIKDGEISLDDEFEVSKKAWKKGGSKMFVNLKSKVRVEDLIRGIIVQSGNDACIVIAEGISGSEEIFADELNELANEIGLENSNFTNSTGWPDKNHLMTVNDLLKLTIRTIEDFPDLYRYYSEKEFTFNNIKQLNRNPLLFKTIGSDGLKTGHTSLGGFGLVATVKKNDRRLILVLNGLKSSSQRSKESERLMKIGFNQFKSIMVADKEKELGQIPVWSGKKKKVSFYSKDEISITVPKSLRKKMSFKIRYQSPLVAPVAEDQHVADFLIKKNDQTIKSYKLYAKNKVMESNFFSKMILNFKFLLFGESLVTTQ
ncbi:MAG: D-alanyl-D-alanine carboxypeptidase [Rickettsiales bacterium]|nr:D-alanyl-D-alanine carboxypeptidase [Rickettsiales bacterium]